MLEFKLEDRHMRKKMKTGKFLLQTILALFLTVNVSGCSWNKMNVEVNQEEEYLDYGENEPEITDESEITDELESTGDSQSADASDSTSNDEVEDFVNEVILDECSLESTAYPYLRSMVTNTPEFYGGSYIDEEGKSVVLLTEDSEENRNAICLALGLSECNTIFKRLHIHCLT